MSKVEYYRSVLKEIQDWDDFLMNESCLPGSRGNLELLYACADLASIEMLVRWLELSPQTAPENTPECFLACCGTAGLGRLLCEGDLSWMASLRKQASDPRWRVREAVCMALQRYGKTDMHGLLREMNLWASGTFFEQRAAIASLCEPVLLKTDENTILVLNLLKQVTENLHSTHDRKSEDFRVLRKGLAYCWSVAVAAMPEKGKNLMDYWFTVSDPDIQWIMKQNLQKNRLLKLDSEWVRQSISKMENDND